MKTKGDLGVQESGDLPIAQDSDSQHGPRSEHTADEDTPGPPVNVEVHKEHHGPQYSG